MSDHRGPHPDDDTLFAESERPRLRKAVYDVSWLRTRGYGDNAVLKLVGDRYRLRRRQRNAVARSACSDDEYTHRCDARRELAALNGEVLAIDTFNVLITLEGALGGAYLFRGRDEAYRDVDPVRRTYRIVSETIPAVEAVRATVKQASLDGVVWYLDDHVSNVGRLKTRIASHASPTVGWEVRVESDVDRALIESTRPVATSDSAILDACTCWCALEREVLRQASIRANVCDLRPAAPSD